MKTNISGIVPVMLTPFTQDGDVDYGGLENLIEWYLGQGADALFAVCQSSEMQHLTLEERTKISSFVVKTVQSRVPVIASGHVADDRQEQLEELNAIAGTGIDGLILVTNRLDHNQDGPVAFGDNLTWLLDRLPADTPLGLYECPAPYRRLLSDEEFRMCRDTERFVILKDVSCDLETVQRRAAMAKGTDFNVINANAAIAFAAMKSGSKGFAGVFTNFHPELYAWMWKNKSSDDPIVAGLANFLALAACAEPMGYPGLAKMFHVKIGTFASDQSRVFQGDLREKFWAIQDVVDHIHEASSRYREKLGI